MANPAGATAAQEQAPGEARELQAAHELSRAFLAASHPLEVYRLALARLAPVVAADFAAIFLRDDVEPETLRPIVVHGWPQASARYLGRLRIAVGRGPTGLAVAENSPVEVANLFADTELREWWEPARELGFTSMIALPLATEFGAIGAISFYFRGARSFDEEERRLLRLISEQLAATTARIRIADALRTENDRLRRENEALAARLDDATRRKREHDELLAETSRDLKRALGSLERELQRMGGAENGAVGTGAALRIVTGLAELTALRLGRIRSERASEDAVRLARQAIDAAVPHAGVTMGFEAGDTIVPVWTDGPTVVRILETLLTHALETTLRGSTQVDVQHEPGPSGGAVSWSVSVTGLGLAPVTGPDDPDGLARRPRPVGALEFALARAYAEILGGAIEVEHAPGRRTFRLRLPSRSGQGQA